MTIVGLIGLLLIAGGAYLLFTGSIIVGIVCVVVGVFLLGGGFGGGRYWARR